MEGLCIWTSHDLFKDHQEIAIELITRNRLTNSEYLSKSIGNSLREIRKKYLEAIERETSTWDVNEHRLKFILKLINKLSYFITMDEWVVKIYFHNPFLS